jgi:hypothetical protein
MLIAPVKHKTQGGSNLKHSQDPEEFGGSHQAQNWQGQRLHLSAQHPSKSRNAVRHRCQRERHSYSAERHLARECYDPRQGGRKGRVTGHLDVSTSSSMYFRATRTCRFRTALRSKYASTLPRTQDTQPQSRKFNTASAGAGETLPRCTSAPPEPSGSGQRSAVSTLPHTQAEGSTLSELWLVKIRL